MQLQPIEGSSLITATAHNPETNTMRVEFSDGRKFDYANVPPEVHEHLRAGGDHGSVGKTFHRTIKGVFDATPVQEEETAEESDGPEA